MEDILLKIKIFYYQTLSMGNVSWMIFGDGCVGHKCMDTTVAQSTT
jgi:hypothetical protein